MNFAANIIFSEKMVMRKKMFQLLRSVADVTERAGMRLKKTPLAGSAVGRRVVDAVFLPSDLRKILFRYRNAFGKFPNLLRPKTFNEYLQRSKVFARKPIYSILADKISVRDYVRERVGEKYLIRQYWKGSDLRKADIGSIPGPFIIKANHLYNANLIVKDKTRIDWAEAYETTDGWLRRDHSLESGEWQYRWIKPCLLVEELIPTENGEVPPDYKFHCVHGRVKLVSVIYGRFGSYKARVFDRDFQVVDLVYEGPEKTDFDMPKPACFEEMVWVAETLSAGEAYLRVDLYDFEGPKFGEITLRPSAGLRRMIPEEMDRIMGRWILGR